MPNIQFQFRRGTAAQWTAANPTLAAGEMGTETDTSKFKIGTGILPWNSLLYGGLEGPQGSLGVTGSQGNVGLQGNQGLQGIQGVTGPQGVQGLQGDPGGPTGPTGNFSGVVGQSILPAVSAAYDIGATGASFRDLYFGASKLSVSNSTLQFSDPNGSIINLGASTNWAQFPAVQNVDMSGYVISNTSGFSISNNSIAGVSNINGQPLTDLGGVNWATFRAVQNVDMSANAVINWARLSNTSGLDISSNNIAGLSNINGQPLTALGGVGWATFRAVQNVDMSGNALINVGRILDASGSAAAPSYTFTADASTGIHYTGSALAFDVSGVQRMTVSSSNVTVSNPLFARMPVTEVSGTSVTLASSNYSTYFYVTNSGFNAVTLPSTTATADAGAFWTLMNATSSSLSITLTNTLNLVSPLIIPSNNAQSLVVSAVTSNTILLL